jgi:serine/threonine protein kinase
VLVDDAGNVWLTGFGIASQVPHERQSPVPPEIIAGTLAYMAPEQTGGMNRSTDAQCFAKILCALKIARFPAATAEQPTRDP